MKLKLTDCSKTKLRLHPNNHTPTHLTSSHFTSPDLAHLVLLHFASPHISQQHTSIYFTSRPTSPHFLSLPSPQLNTSTSAHKMYLLALPHNIPHLTTPHLTAPHHNTSAQLISTQLALPNFTSIYNSPHIITNFRLK